VPAVIWYLFLLLAALAANNLHAYYAVLFVSSHFLFRSVLPVGPKSLLAALLTQCAINAKQIAGIFSWTANSAFIHEKGKL